MAVLRIPTPLRPYVEGKSEIPVTGETVNDALAGVTGQYPGLKPHLFTQEGQLRTFVNLFVNEDDIRNLSGLNTPIRETDRLLLIPSIAGGLEGCL
jgi:molybdopterin synthase sulfur carrier subunit